MVFLDIGQVNEIDDELKLFRTLFKLGKNTRNPYIISQGGRITQHLVEFLARNGRTIDENIYNTTFKKFLEKCDYIPEPIKNFILIINDLRKNVIYSSKDKKELNETMVYYLETFYEILTWFENYYDEEFANNEMKFKEINKTKRYLNRKIDEYEEGEDLEEFPNDSESFKLAFIEFRNELKDMNKNVKGIKEDVEDIKEDVAETKETVHTIDYKMDQFLEKFEVFYDKYAEDQEEISKKLESSFFTDEEKNKFMKEFTEKCVEGVTNCVGKTIAKKDFKREQNRLIKSLTDENWKKLSKDSQTWLTTSIITYKGIKKLDNVVDYSGVCLLITKAIEIELRKRFYKGFSNYLNKHYHKNYYEYHTSLLRYPYDSEYNSRLKKNRDCDLGRITYILCYKKDKDITDEKIHQNNLDKLIEYSQPKYFKDLNEKEIENLLYTYGEYVDEIRKEYRNPSAHTGALDKDKANDCFDYVFRKTEVLKTMLDSFDV